MHIKNPTRICAWEPFCHPIPGDGRDLQNSPYRPDLSPRPALAGGITVTHSRGISPHFLPEIRRTDCILNLLYSIAPSKEYVKREEVVFFEDKRLDFDIPLDIHSGSCIIFSITHQKLHTMNVRIPHPAYRRVRRGNWLESSTAPAAVIAGACCQSRKQPFGTPGEGMTAGAGTMYPTA